MAVVGRRSGNHSMQLFYTADPWGERFLQAEGERGSSEKNNYSNLQRADKGKN